LLPNHKTLLERLEKEDNETTWRVDFKATLEYLITAQHIKNSIHMACKKGQFDVVELMHIVG